MPNRVLPAVAALAVACLATACGGSTAATESAGSSSSASGKTIWYADVIEANPVSQAITQAVNTPLTAAGATMTRSFSVNNTTGSIDPAVQAEALTRAIGTQPAAIAYFVLDSKSMKPQVQRARDKGIPVFAALGKPEGFDVNGYITNPDEEQGYQAAKYLADHLPKGAKIALIGGPVTPNVTAELAGAQRALKEAGATIVGNLDQQRNLQDNAAGGQTVMQGILQREPDVQGVFVYNDDSALGAIAAAKQSGKKIRFTSRNGTADAIAAIKAGDLLATCDLKPVEIGKALGQAMVDHLSGVKTYDNNAQIPGPPADQCMVDKDNVAGWKPAEELIKFQTIKTG
ncbi:sugar ABC transporter substrate-binding protein [Nonomuraea sp. NPDC049784]|uniref:sugar ABC transporter substrate-binding protein n=1 Tax=Nonomuraea sp. NPDC049784 TaxID=3154361 RepID=UPI0033E356C6